MGVSIAVNTLNVTLDLSALAKMKWYEYVVVFLSGGTITVIAGLLAREFGPAFGGLFLAFPAVFPASATLIEKHEKERSAEIANNNRGRQAAALDARGAEIGSIGLVCFAFVVWKLLPVWNAGLVFCAALGAWLLVSTTIWSVSEIYRRKVT
jgi:Protein of unknown function (DUF3147)